MMFETDLEPFHLGRPMAFTDWEAEVQTLTFSLSQTMLAEIYDQPLEDSLSWAFPDLGKILAHATSPPLLFIQWGAGIAKNFLDETVEFWALRTRKLMSREQAREATDNVVGFVKTLARWEKAERPQRK